MEFSVFQIHFYYGKKHIFRTLLSSPKMFFQVENNLSVFLGDNIALNGFLFMVKQNKMYFFYLGSELSLIIFLQT